MIDTFSKNMNFSPRFYSDIEIRQKHPCQNILEIFISSFGSNVFGDVMMMGVLLSIILVSNLQLVKAIS